jgi:hypothetical protein
MRNAHASNCDLGGEITSITDLEQTIQSLKILCNNNNTTFS